MCSVNCTVCILCDLPAVSLCHVYSLYILLWCLSPAVSLCHVYSLYILLWCLSPAVSLCHVYSLYILLWCLSPAVSLCHVYSLYILLCCLSAKLCMFTQRAPRAQPPCRRVGDEPQLFLIQAIFGHSSWSSSSSSNESAVSYLADCFSTAASRE